MVRALEVDLIKYPLMPMGVLAPGSVHARPSAQPPIDVSGNFPTPMSAEFLPTPQKSYPKFQNSTTSLSKKYLKLSDFPVKIGLIGEVGGVPPKNVQQESCYLYYLGAHAKI